MCYFATTDFACGDWKWGNMKLRCPRQHRIGETCGAKLVHHESVTKSPELCRTCQDIEIKKRRLNKEKENIARWSKEGNKFRASIEKAQTEAAKLTEAIQGLYERRISVTTKMSSSTYGLGSSSTPSYETSNSLSQPVTTQMANSYSSANRHATAAQGGYPDSSGQGCAYSPNYGNGPAARQSSAYPAESGNGSTGMYSTPYVNTAPSRHTVPYPSGYGN